jgi:hypothetical protein
MQVIVDIFGASLGAVGLYALIALACRQRPEPAGYVVFSIIAALTVIAWYVEQ